MSSFIWDRASVVCTISVVMLTTTRCLQICSGAVLRFRSAIVTVFKSYVKAHPSGHEEHHRIVSGQIGPICHNFMFPVRHDPEQSCRDSWPRTHPSWALPSHLQQTVVAAGSHCIDELGVEVDVAHLPPSQILVSTNGSAELPSACCRQPVRMLQSGHKIAAAFSDLVAHVDSAADNGPCDPREWASHQCALWHPEHPARLVAFEVHLLQVQSFSPSLSTAAAAALNSGSAQAAAEEWQPVLQSRLGGAPVAMDALDGLLVVYVQPRHLAAAASALAQQSVVAYVLPRRSHFLHNLRDITLQLQAASPATGGAVAREAQFWDAGVNGSGQVIGLGDSGLDVQHCAFADSAVPFDSFTLDGTQVPVFRSPNHRKVTLYYMCSPLPSTMNDRFVRFLPSMPELYSTLCVWVRP